MRISDWSSDVCSSDLRNRHEAGGTASKLALLPPASPVEQHRTLESAIASSLWPATKDKRRGPLPPGAHCRVAGPDRYPPMSLPDQQEKLCDPSSPQESQTPPRSSDVPMHRWLPGPTRSATCQEEPSLHSSHSCQTPMQSSA